MEVLGWGLGAPVGTDGREREREVKRAERSWGSLPAAGSRGGGIGSLDGVDRRSVDDDARAGCKDGDESLLSASASASASRYSGGGSS